MFMETTSIPPERTAAEIRVELVKAGANKIMEEYAGGEISAVTFAISRNGSDIPFRLPIRVDPVFKALNTRRKSWDRSAKAPDDLAQAKRVAWRQVYRWIQAQVALIQTGMVQTEEVFFPYLSNGRNTVYEIAAASDFKALPMPQEMEA